MVLSALPTKNAVFTPLPPTIFIIAIMKFLILLMSLATAFACSAAEKLPPGHPPIDSNVVKTAPALLPQKAKVLDVINVPQYTYLEVSQGKETRWLAAPTVAVNKGDIIRFDNGLLMANFHSNGLDRTFPSISFVNSVEISTEKE